MTRSLTLLLGISLTAAAQPPPNDAQSAAYEANGSSFVLVGDLRDATREAFEPSSVQFAGTSIWWRWRAPDAGTWIWDAGVARSSTAVTVLTIDDLGQWRIEGQSPVRPRPGTGAFGLPGYEAWGTGSFVAEAGREYWIRVDAVQSSGGMVIIGGPGGAGESQPVEVSFSRRAGGPPSNDRFAQAAALDLATPVLKSILMGATSETGEPPVHAAALGRSLWWRLESPGPGTVSVSFAGDPEPPAVAVYRRAAWNRLQQTAHSVTEFGNECARYWRARDVFRFDTAPGDTYFLQVDGLPGRDLEASFAAALRFDPAPANDDLNGARVLDGRAWEVEATNTGATGQPGDPQVPGHEGTSSVWFKWDTGEGGLLQVTIGDPTVFAEPNAELLPPGGGGSGGVVSTLLNPCGGPFADLHPEPAFVPVIGLFHRFGSSGDLPLLQYRVHGTNEIWAEVSGAESWIWLDGPEGVTGNTPLKGRLTPSPANDTRERRLALPAAAVRVTGRTAGARSEAGDRLPSGAGDAAMPRRSVWWEWSAPSAGTWVLRPVTGAWENCFAIYPADAAAESEPLVWTTAAPVQFDVAAGQVLHVAALGVMGLGSNLEFRLEPATGPVLGIPTIHRTDGEARWIVPLAEGWRQPVDAEISQDLRTWMPVPVEGAGSGSELSLPWPADAPAGFLRVRVR